MKRMLTAAALALAVCAVPGMQAPASAWGGFSCGLGLNISLTGYWYGCCCCGPPAPSYNCAGGYYMPQPYDSLAAGGGYPIAGGYDGHGYDVTAPATTAPTTTPSLPAPTPTTPAPRTPGQPTSFYPTSGYGYGFGSYEYGAGGAYGYPGSAYGYPGGGFQSPSYWYGQ
jgi:hypothetical protein